jgi:hypothetical protein
MNTFPFATRRPLSAIALAIVVLAATPKIASVASADAKPTTGTHDHTEHVHPASDGSTTPVLTAKERKAIVRATKKFRNVDAAIAAGYQPTEACVAAPDLGGMGYHYVNPTYLMDGVIDPQKPDILLFHRDDTGKLRLGGVEYFSADLDQDLATDDDRPNLHGHPFDGPMPGHEPGMPIHYDLHVWLYTNNPTGELSAWNHDVTCP